MLLVSALAEDDECGSGRTAPKGPGQAAGSPTVR